MYKVEVTLILREGYSSRPVKSSKNPQEKVCEIPARIEAQGT